MKRKIIPIIFIFAFLISLISCGTSDVSGIYIDGKSADVLTIQIYSSEMDPVTNGEGIYLTIVELIEKHESEMPSVSLGSISEITLVGGKKTEIKLIGIYEENGTKTSYKTDSSVPNGKYIVCAKKTLSDGKKFSSDYLFLKVEIK